MNNAVSLYTKDGRIVNYDLHVSYISFWNSGRVSIDKQDILKEIFIKLNDEGRFISIEKISTRGEGITKINAHSKLDKSIAIALDQLDLDMGAKYRIVYTTKDRDSRSIIDFGQEILKGFVNGPNSTFHITGYIKEGNIKDSIGLLKQIFVVSLLLLLFFIAVMVLLAFTKVILGESHKVSSVISIINPQIRWINVVLFLVIICLSFYLSNFGSGPIGLGVTIEDVVVG